MKLNIEQVRNISQGAAKIVSEDGKYRFFRFSKAEAETIDNENLLYTAGIQMEFKTDGSLLKLKVNTAERTSIRSYFSFDIFVNNVLVGCINNLNDEDCIGNYAEQVYKLGKFYGEFDLGNDEKCVRIVFPHSVVSDVEEIEIVDATYIEPVKREKTIVVYGDSITQGYDALHPSKTYAMQLADAFNAELINKALGGAIFSPELAAVPNDINADYVFVAYGTNDWSLSDQASFRKNADDFLSAIEKNYPCTPIFVITPIWRKDWNADKPFGEFKSVESIINEVSKNHKNAMVISALNLVPHDESLFGDLRLHPSDKGFKYYYDNLIKVIKNFNCGI